MSVRISIIGGSGYLGGELLRLLLFHPQVEVDQVSSRSHAGRYLHSRHPNLRGITDLRFCHMEQVTPCDVLFLALPHGEVAGEIQHYTSLAERVIDCSADFRLRHSEDYLRWYGWDHPMPEWLDRFVYGLPERHRQSLHTANYVSGVGCNATVLNLALGPLADAGWLDRVTAEIKVGSSEAGARQNPGSHHPERSGVVRVYSPAGHRHLAEVEQELGNVQVHLVMTAVEMVRGAHLTAHCFLRPEIPVRTMRDVWGLYREAYGEEPFIRLVAERRGLYRYPEPKVLSGSNYCDIGFALDTEGQILVVIAALDNLMKGGAGTAVQAMNLMIGLDERTGLAFPGLHPI